MAGKIAANSVTALEIAANAVTSIKLAANSVVAGKIAANAITATNIQAGAITTDRLSVSSLGINRVTNGNFEGATYISGVHTFPEGWGNLDGNMSAGSVVGTGVGSNGVGIALRLDPPPGGDMFVLSKGFPVQNGQTYSWSCRYLAEATITSGIFLGLDVCSVQDSYSSNTIVQQTFPILDVGGTGNVWNYAEGKITATTT